MINDKAEIMKMNQMSIKQGSVIQNILYDYPY